MASEIIKKELEEASRQMQDNRRNVGNYKFALQHNQLFRMIQQSFQKLWGAQNS